MKFLFLTFDISLAHIPFHHSTICISLCTAVTVFDPACIVNNYLDYLNETWNYPYSY